MKLKFVLIVAFVTASFTVLFAQTIPQSDFVVKLNPTSVSLSKGDTASVLVSITRSKLFKKGTSVFGLSSPNKKGIAVDFKNDATDSCILIILARDNAEPGSYTIVPNCTVHGKTIGSILKLTINP